MLDEESKVKQQLAEGLVDANIAVQIHGLAKTYAGTRNIGCCCKCTKTAPYTAVKVKYFLLNFLSLKLGVIRRKLVDFHETFFGVVSS